MRGDYDNGAREIREDEEGFEKIIKLDVDESLTIINETSNSRV